MEDHHEKTFLLTFKKTRIQASETKRNPSKLWPTKFGDKSRSALFASTADTSNTITTRKIVLLYLDTSYKAQGRSCFIFV